jgi:hypothetical protein
VNIILILQQQQQPSLLVPSKLGYVRDETTRAKEKEIKHCRKRRGKTKDDKNKNQFDKRRKDNKTLRKK